MRPSPTESATKFKPGTLKKGNDGKIWEIVTTAKGTHRWKRIGKANPNFKKGTVKKKALTASPKNKVSIELCYNEGASGEKLTHDSELRQLIKKYKGVETASDYIPMKGFFRSYNQRCINATFTKSNADKLKKDLKSPFFVLFEN